jgi:carboxyl-terminal processing protease
MTNLGVKIPVGSYNYEELTEENNGQVGFNFIIFNSDGQNFYPVILNVFKDSPAYAKGLKFEDIILTVNGISTTNKSVKQTMLLLRGNAGTKISLTIERTDRILNKTLIKTLRPSAK